MLPTIATPLTIKATRHTKHMNQCQTNHAHDRECMQFPADAQAAGEICLSAGHRRRRDCSDVLLAQPLPSSLTRTASKSFPYRSRSLPTVPSRGPSPPAPRLPAPAVRKTTPLHRFRWPSRGLAAVPPSVCFQGWYGQPKRGTSGFPKPKECTRQTRIERAMPKTRTLPMVHLKEQRQIQISKTI